ncbi:sugar phosphate isomerase/epimerase family protein [Escherichia coli]
MRQLLPHSKDVGVPIALEPLHPMTAARSLLPVHVTPGAGLRVINSIPMVSLAWRGGRCLSRLVRSGSRQSDPAYRKRILAFHVSDWLVPTTDLVNDRGMPGDGVINIPSIRRLVENAGFNGAIELEIFSPYWWQKILTARWILASIASRIIVKDRTHE